MTTREVVERYFATINARDWDGWLELFTADVVMDEALSGHLEGLDAMRESAAGIEQGFAEFKNHLEHLIVEGNQAAAVCRIEAMTVTGVSLVSTGANFYQLKDGNICYMSSYHDSVPFVAAFGQSVAE